MKAFKRTRFKIQIIIVGSFLVQIIVVQILWTSDLNQYLILQIVVNLHLIFAVIPAVVIQLKLAVAA